MRLKIEPDEGLANRRHSTSSDLRISVGNPDKVSFSFNGKHTEPGCVPECGKSKRNCGEGGTTPYQSRGSGYAKL
jgi:hypothetical protein